VGVLVQPSRRSGRDPGVTLLPAKSAASLPPPAHGFAIPRPRELTGDGAVTRWAPVIQATEARRAPSFASRVVTPVGRLTPEGTTNLVDADGEVTREGQTWVRVRPAVLPDGLIGWVPRRALGGWSFVNTRAVIDRAALTFTLYRDRSIVFRAPVGIGTSSTPTPAGHFYVRDRLTAYASPEYGPVAFGTSARSPYETDWPAGGFIGIHGTDQPGLIPGRISHGCVRLKNAAILALAKLMPVGTPVTIT
jgi:lipoprotein-anchoring transpeptidase ErfK/SrfK